MVIERNETWGTLCYDVSTHQFSAEVMRDVQEEPYVSLPVVLNVYLTLRCNMLCEHCVAKDMERYLGSADGADLRVTDNLIDDINESPFMVVVITGGEPLLPDLEPSLIGLLEGLENKGIIVDTNGTVLPSRGLIDQLREKQAMLRVSWDSPSPNIECELRKYRSGMYSSDESYMEHKEELIRILLGEGLTVAAQTVLHGRNSTDRHLPKRLPRKMKELGVNSWYVQRYIPSYKKKNASRYLLGIDAYEKALARIRRAATKLGIACHTKKDRRHNSVFLLAEDGQLFTQSDTRPGEKVCLGNIAHIENYFEFVSQSEHSVRYVEAARGPHST